VIEKAIVVKLINVVNWIGLDCRSNIETIKVEMKKGNCEVRLKY